MRSKKTYATGIPRGYGLGLGDDTAVSRDYDTMIPSEYKPGLSREVEEVKINQPLLDADTDLLTTGNSRILEMIFAGVYFTTAIFRLGNEVLRWDFASHLTERIPQSEPDSWVWIQITRIAHSRPWFINLARKSLHRFALRVGLPDERREQARHVRPRMRGLMPGAALPQFQQQIQ